MNKVFSTTLDSAQVFGDQHSVIETSILIPQSQVSGQYAVHICFGEQRLISHCEVLNKWPCGSVKWLKITYINTPRANETTANQTLNCNIYDLSACPSNANNAGQQARPDKQILNIVTNKNNTTFCIQHNDKHIECSWSLHDLNGSILSIDSCLTTSSLKYADDGNVFATCIDTQATLKTLTGKTILFHATYYIYHHAELIDIQACLHNPDASLHQQGRWDLGDPHSFVFSSFQFDALFSDATDIMVATDSDDSLRVNHDDVYEIYQHASGGQNWNSPVHVDASNKVPMVCNGYVETVNKNQRQVGNRASPKIDILFDDSCCQLVPKQFWQKFPSALTLLDKKASLYFLPKLNYFHELQAGEKTSCHLQFNFANNRFAGNSRTLPINREDAVAFSFNHATECFSGIINAALQGPNSFFAKREQIDEYGWRNFGDLYADHETAYHQGPELFVSHYNNQYDAIFGFLKQYLISGNHKWFELADDLAKHVKDIDIYHTTQDKAEYNGGLFWHTDHYLPAFTSTHRSYSKFQDSNAYQDHAGGGGPGGQHCYTTGLMLHYLLTGNETSKQAVLTLSNWIKHFYEGTNTCLELLLAFKNRDLTGTKNHFSGQYPLDRGTANYIVALLDSFELTQERHYVKQVENIITHTIHPTENVDLRNLSDVESTWFYTVFLQAVCRYLLLKQQLKEYDEMFYYARDSLLNFANWMVDNEYMYLDKPTILEYPNDTWTAQDLRKASIFAAASYFSPQDNEIYLAKARYFETEVASRLNHSETKTYTRIMILVLQNCGQVDFYANLARQTQLQDVTQDWPAPSYANRGLYSSFVKILAKRLLGLSLKAEIHWLKKRLS